MTELTQQLPMEIGNQEEATPQPADKAQETYRNVCEIYSRSGDWVTFFREVLGVDGILRKMFQNPKELAAFERGPVYADIQQMLAKLRERTKHANEDGEPSRVITVRLPKCVHDALRSEAHDRKISMNQLCISKLLQLIEEKLVPAE